MEIAYCVEAVQQQMCNSAHDVLGDPPSPSTTRESTTTHAAAPGPRHRRDPVLGCWSPQQPFQRLIQRVPIPFMDLNPRSEPPVAPKEHGRGESDLSPAYNDAISVSHYVSDHPCALNDLRSLIEQDPHLARCSIISLRAFAMPWPVAITHGTVPHRFILLELRSDEEDKLWLKLERRPDSKIALLRGFGETAAKDEGQFLEHNRGILFRRGYRQENEYLLDRPHPTLRDLGIVVDVICRLHPQYTLFSRNCWMFSFLLQDLLVWLAEVSHQMSPPAPCYQKLAVKSRLQLQQIYHMPEPITIATTLCALQNDIRFAGRAAMISQAIANYEMWEMSLGFSSHRHFKALPKLIDSIDTITDDMDGIGYRAEAASIWCQMILMLKRQFKRAPSEYHVHLGVSWEQYSMFLFVCGRQQEARIAEGEASKHGSALCDAGASALIAPTPTYYRYRQRALFDFGDYHTACADASQFVCHCRRLYLSEGAQHADRLALALLWHREPLARIGRISEADACVDEAVALVQSRRPADGEVNLSRLDTSVSLSCALADESNQPLRFKHPLTRHFDIFWKTDWGTCHERAIAVEARAVMCARELFKISPAEHGDLLAQTLRHYGNALHHAREYEAACDAKAEAVKITHELGRLHPGKYMDELADRLKEYGVSLHFTGMYEDACRALSEAIVIIRPLSQLHPSKYKTELAELLREYGVSLHERAMYEAACNVKAEAVNITRELCTLHPGKYEAELADRLQRYSLSLHNMEMYEAARNAAADAVNIARGLCLLYPGKYKAELADHLKKYSIVLHFGKMHTASCDALAEAVSISRQLCQFHPGTCEAELADQLREYGVSLHNLEMYEVACKVMAEAVDIMGRLCQLFPGEYKAKLADSLLRYAFSLHCRKMYDAACDVKLEAVGIMRELCQLHPTRYDPELADHLRQYGFSLHCREMYEAACNAVTEAISILRGLRRLHPGKYMAELADCLRDYGVLLQCREMHTAACNTRAESVDITREICRRCPGKRKANLAEQLHGYGRSLYFWRMCPAAYNAERETVNAARVLCRARPDSIEGELAARLGEYADSLYSTRRFCDARNAKAEAVKITRELCQLHPGECKAELAGYLLGYGVSLHNMGMYEAACDNKAEAINITRELYQLHPGEYKAELVGRLREYGSSLHAWDMHEAARDAEAEAVNVARSEENELGVLAS